MNTEVIMIIVAVLVLLGVLSFFILKKEKYATSQPTYPQPPTLTQFILSTISNVLNEVSLIKASTQNKLDYENDLSAAISIAAIYISKNIDDINTYVTAYKASASSTNHSALELATGNLFSTSAYNAMQELSLKYGSNTSLNSKLARISSNLFIIYLNMRLLDEENFSAITNTESYKSLLTIFPEFPNLRRIQPNPN